MEIKLQGNVRTDTMLVLSTAHMTSEDNELLKQWAGPLAVNPFIEVFTYDCGYLIWLGSPDWREQPLAKKLSPSLFWLLSHVPENIQWVRFDADADTTDAFQTFNW